MKAWINTLRGMNYNFPKLVNQTEGWYGIGEKWSNCREANLDLGVETYSPEKEKVGILGLEYRIQRGKSANF